MKKNNKKGFTLVELLVVIAIIAIIAAVAVPVTIGQINKAKIGTAVDEANQVKTNVVNAVTELATTGVIKDDELASNLSEIYTEMKQVTDIFLAQATPGTSDITITIVTSTNAPKTADTTKGYVNRKKTDGTAGVANTDYVAVEFTMKGNGVKLTKKAQASTGVNKIHVTWSTNAFADVAG